MLYCSWTVSYTHLDVYKRQTQIISQFTEGDTQMILAGQKSLFANGLTFIPVSYTHLDVYKRQGTGRGTPKQKAQVVQELRQKYPLEALLQLAGLPRSTFYYLSLVHI